MPGPKVFRKKGPARAPRAPRRDLRLLRLSKLCLSFPETSCRQAGDHAQYLVRGKTFAYYLNNHHGDGIVSVTTKVEAGLNQALARSDPEHFYVPAYLGPRGWVALRLDRRDTGWAEVSRLLATGYRLVAPRRLALEIAAPGLSIS